MPFEDLDKKIKEAADKHHPAYDEKAWQKMEILLNQELPQPKKDRRRILFVLLLVLLVGGGIWTITSKPWENNARISAKSVNGNSKNTERGQQKNNSATARATKKESSTANENTPKASLNQSVISQEIILNNKNKNLITNNQKHLSNNKQQKDQAPQTFPEKQSADLQVAATPEKKNDLMSKQDFTNSEPQKDESNMATANQEITKQENPKPSEEIAKGAPEKINSPKKRKLTGSNGFTFSVSAGPDVSQVRSSKTGKVRLAYGLGVGYTKNRFTLSTGIYAARKVYSAEAKYYKLGYAAPPNYTFESADANCSVLEIPLKIGYNFSSGASGNWFVSTGLSSYLMKKEKYVYNYKTSWGPYAYHHDVSNENKHYFSVLDLSAGYTRRLNHVLSLTAEPYLEIPLVGIGEGKVNLRSGGVLFTLGVKPFKK